MEKSDEKLDSMAVLMLHYCAGLQHCLDQEEVERVKQLEEEKRSGDDGGGTDSAVLQCVNTDRHNINIESDEGASTCQNGDTTTMLTDGSGQTDVEEETLTINVTEAEVSSGVEEEIAEGVTFVTDGEVLFSISDKPDSHQTEDDLRIETHSEADDAATHTSNVLTCSTEENVDVEEESALSVETRRTEDSAKFMHNAAL